MSAHFTFARQGRTPRAAVTLVLIWTALLLAWWWLEAAPWIVAFLALFTLPALWDLIRDPPSGFELSDEAVQWFSGKRHASVALEEIDHVRLDTRLDFSVRATLVLTSGAKVRLPFEATPPDQALEKALEAQGIRTKRFHFQLFQ